jgi:assimilatory nitrate reductase catalytic subunit
MALVCSCHGVNTRRIRDAIARGADSVESIGDFCLAGTCCLSCHPTLDALLDEATVTSVAVRRRFRLLTA